MECIVVTPFWQKATSKLSEHNAILRNDTEYYIWRWAKQKREALLPHFHYMVTLPVNGHANVLAIPQDERDPLVIIG